jgi:hypothetical protein
MLAIRGHNEFVPLQPIQVELQPTAELLIEGMVSVAHRRLGHLSNGRLRVAQQQM